MNTAWLELEEAQARILGAADGLPPEQRPLGESMGLYSAAEVAARFDSPPFDNSTVDGYAMRSADCGHVGGLELAGRQPAGVNLGLSVQAGQCLRIFTGAPMPAGADCVAMQEDCLVEGGRVFCPQAHEGGENIRRAGADLCTGQLICRRGQRLTPALIGLLASQGLSHVQVHPTPSITVISTGDELKTPGCEPLKPGEIFESVGFMLSAQIAETGPAQVARLHCGDDPSRLAEMLHHSSHQSDLIILSGGVSVGEHDPVKPALALLGIQPDFWRLRIKPGKPFLFARIPRQRGGHCLVFGLPGNPVSAFVTFELLARPALLRLMGATQWQRPKLTARLRVAVNNPDDRPHFIRGRLLEQEFEPLGLQQSHAIFGLSLCNALLRLEPGVSLPTGQNIEITPCTNF